MEEALVSVIIPAYNHEKYVQETIKSIIQQTYRNIELLIIDDGSKDSTWQKIQEMKSECENRFIRFYLETKENEGTCKTLNKLLSLANGKYIYLIASDDKSYPLAIEKEVSFMESHADYSLVVGNNEIIDENGNTCYWDKKRKIIYDAGQARTRNFVEYLKRHNNFFNDKDFGKYSTIFRGNYIPNGYLIRKSIYDKIGYYPDGQFVEDWWFMLQVSKYSKMKYLDEILFSYRWHNSNIIKNSEKMKILSDNTLSLEVAIQNKINRNEVNQDVITTIDKGVLYKRQGIPFFFEIVTIKKGMHKIKTIKIFNIKIYTFKKEY